MTIKKFTTGAKHESVDKDEIISANDWVLRWSPDEGGPEDSGFSLYTPKDFDAQDGGPLGGLVLAAFFFLLQHSEPDFAQDMISKANALSKKMHEEGAWEKEENQNISIILPGKTLN